jgi:KipI family sensor histidine kinase inhibitor
MSAPDEGPTLNWVGDRHLLVSFDPITSPRAEVFAVTARLTAQPPPNTIDIVPAESSILISFNAETFDPAAALAHATATLRTAHSSKVSAPARTIDIPICYGGPFGPDLGDAALHCSLTNSQLIEAHAAACHTVAFLGFAPGFPYISGLPPALNVPRLASPRTRVPIGSVGIAGDKTGIYPREGPGGWRLIGRTPLRMFDAHRPQPVLLRAGDLIRFLPIDASEFERLQREGR